MIALIIAMPQELEAFLETVDSAVSLRYGGKTIYECEYKGIKFVMALSGIGKVNAAYTATLMIEKYSPSFLITTGAAGGFGLDIYDVFVAEKVVQHDIDTTAFGDPRGYINGLGVVYIDADKGFVKLCESKLNGVKTGVIASGDQFIASGEIARKIAKEFGASSCDMESGAIGQVAYMAGVPFGVIRTITDGGNDEAQTSFAEKLKKAVEINKNAVLGIIGLVEKHGEKTAE